MLEDPMQRSASQADTDGAYGNYVESLWTLLSPYLGWSTVRLSEPTGLG